MVNRSKAKSKKILEKIIKKSIQTKKTFDIDELCSFVCDMLEFMFGEEMEEELEKLELYTVGDIKKAIYDYIAHYFDYPIHSKTVLTKEVREIFAMSLERVPYVSARDKPLIVEAVEEVLEERYGENGLEFEKIKLSLHTRSRISRMLDLYIYETKDIFRNVSGFLF